LVQAWEEGGEAGSGINSPLQSEKCGERMSDYKYGMQLIAEELAEDRYGKGFYELTDEQQFSLYNEAMDQYVERRLP
jgi:hypothetical protein